MTTYADIEMKIIQWSEKRQIIPNSTPQAQLLKAFEEMGELAAGEVRNKMPLIEDAVGDVIICLVNYCALRDINLVSCMQLAYDQIKDRKGTMMPNGVFVKSE